MTEMGALNERLTALNEEIGSEEAKKTNFTKALMEKVSVGDALDDKLRTIASKINQLEKIEYPGENEREMLVSLDGKFRNIRTLNICCVTILSLCYLQQI